MAVLTSGWRIAGRLITVGQTVCAAAVGRHGSHATNSVLHHSDGPQGELRCSNCWSPGRARRLLGARSLSGDPGIALSLEIEGAILDRWLLALSCRYARSGSNFGSLTGFCMDCERSLPALLHLRKRRCRCRPRAGCRRLLSVLQSNVRPDGIVNTSLELEQLARTHSSEQLIVDFGHAFAPAIYCILLAQNLNLINARTAPGARR